MTNLLGSFAMETIKLILLHLLTLQASLGRHFLISTHDEKIKAAGDEAGDDYYDPGPKDYRDYGDCSGWNPANNLVGNCPGSSGKFLTSLLYNFFRANLVSFLGATTSTRAATTRTTTTTCAPRPLDFCTKIPFHCGCIDGPLG